MIRRITLALILMSAVHTAVLAGGMLTNTNQSIDFLRNPARDAAIGIDGVYSNPAGVAFLPEGLHLSVNWQAAWQTRTIDTTNPTFALGARNNGLTKKTYEGISHAPFIPSVLGSYNFGKWSLQFGMSVTGGGGKCEFANGLGSFEGAVGSIASQLVSTSASLNSQFSPLGVSIPVVTGYDCDGYMQGNQYYFGFTVGAAYRITDNLSVYGGLRFLYGTASYKARIDNIKVKCQDADYTLQGYFDQVSGGMVQASESVTAGKAQIIGAYSNAISSANPQLPAEQVQNLAVQMAAGNETYQQLDAAQQRIEGAAATLSEKAEALTSYYNGVNLQSDQTGFGLAPIIGADFKYGQFNFAVKYEFRTRMSMENKSTVKQAMQIEAVNQFVDGTSIREDQPSLLAFGVQWSPIDEVRIMGGYHHFYDTHAKKYGDRQKQLSGGTNEYLGGVEWDPIKKLTVSTGIQVTRYGNTDEFMRDLSYVVNSWSVGVGAKYKLNEKVALQAAYFRTNYSDYTTAMSSDGIQNTFTRSNNVFGVGCELNF